MIQIELNQIIKRYKETLANTQHELIVHRLAVEHLERQVDDLQTQLADAERVNTHLRNEVNSLNPVASDDY